MTHKHLFCFGYGFCAKALISLMRARHKDWQISATTRSHDKIKTIKTAGAIPLMLNDKQILTEGVMGGVTHILLCAPPLEDGSDPGLNMFGEQLLNYPSVEWVGYLSTTGVYGDHRGAWIDEDSPVGVLGTRGVRRRRAEAAWAQSGLPMHYFRLAGIYGLGRNALESLKNGTARRIHKPEQVFSRIHVDDIAQILFASMVQPNPGRAYNLCDDLPAPPQDVVTYASDLMGIKPPPLVSFERASLRSMSSMAKSFYAENKRVRNGRIKRELGIKLLYPTYKEGLRAILHQESDL